MKCSICGTEPAVLVDRKEKGTYWMCGDCVWEMIEDKRKLEGVVRAAEKYQRQAMLKGEHMIPLEHSVAHFEFVEALEALPEYLRGE